MPLLVGGVCSRLCSTHSRPQIIIVRGPNGLRMPLPGHGAKFVHVLVGKVIPVLIASEVRECLLT